MCDQFGENKTCLRNLLAYKSVLLDIFTIKFHFTLKRRFSSVLKCETSKEQSQEQDQFAVIFGCRARAGLISGFMTGFISGPLRESA
jgi:hypothetical protein